MMDASRADKSEAISLTNKGSLRLFRWCAVHELRTARTIVFLRRGTTICFQCLLSIREENIFCADLARILVLIITAGMQH